MSEVQYANEVSYPQSQGVTQGFSEPRQTIHGHIEAVEGQAKQLHETYETLASRLVSILGPEGADKMGEPLRAATERSPIADQIAQIRDTLDRLNGRLHSLMARLEV